MSITRPVPTSDDLIGPDSEGIYKRLGRIEQADLGWEGHGIFTVFLSFDFGGLHQGLPGGCLDAPVKDETGKFTGREGTAFGHDYIIGVMQAVGVERCLSSRASWPTPSTRTATGTPRSSASRPSRRAPIPAGSSSRTSPPSTGSPV
jgi:hypothetical protein